MPIYGNKSGLGIIQQNSFDTIADIANSNTSIPYLSETFTTNLEDILAENIDGLYDEKDRYKGKQHVSGDIEIEAGARSLPHILSLILAKQSSVTSNSMYTHEWLPRETEALPNCWNKPFTVYKGSSTTGLNEQNLYNLCGTALEISLENGGFLKAKLSAVGGINADATAAGANSYYASDEQFTWDNSSLSLGGVGFKAINASISITDPIEPQYTLANSLWPRSNNLTGFRDVTFNMTIPWDNNSDYTRFFNATTLADADLNLYCRGATADAAGSGYYYDFTAQLARAVYETFEASAGGPGEIELSISGRAQYSTNSSYTAKINMINTDTGAAF